MAANENQLDLIGRNIDRVVTVEARISGTSRNVIAHHYEAARLRQGGGPLSVLAARLILTHLGCKARPAPSRPCSPRHP